jgi:hypothetical protein
MSIEMNAGGGMPKPGLYLVAQPRMAGTAETIAKSNPAEKASRGYAIG